MSGNDYRIVVVDRTLDLIEAIAAADGPVGVSELARTIGSTKSAVFRLLVNLERRGYVVRDPVGGKYQLGGQLVRLGQRALESSDIRARARAVLESLHLRFNETVNLGVLVDGRITYVDMIESEQGLRMAARIGATDDVHSTSLGKAILSFLPEAEREHLLRQPLRPRTARTLTDADALRVELAAIVEHGIAEDHGENEDGARCFGAPIFDHERRVIAAVSVSSPESRVDDDRAGQISSAVRAAAQLITERIGGTWPLARELPEHASSDSDEPVAVAGQ